MDNLDENNSTWKIQLGKRYYNSCSKCFISDLNKKQFLSITWKLTFMHYFSNIEVEYPCEFGFEYMIAGAAVWLCFLPCYLVTLLGNCWRQCCCCLCDPLVSYNLCVSRILLGNTMWLY